MLATAPPELALYDVQADFVDDAHRYAAFVGGVGSGKTLGGAAKALVQELPYPRLGLVAAPTYKMLRDATWRTALEVWAPLRPTVYRQEMRMAFPTGAEVLFRSADDPDSLRGPNCSWAWLDEAAYCAPETWPTVIGRLREDGRAGRAWVTTTPRGPNWVHRVFAEQASADTALYRGTTARNPFVAPEFVAALRGQYTARLARQELEGEWLEDVEGALWQRDRFRYRAAPDLQRVVVAIDPAATATEASDETGIVVAGLGVDGAGYILADRSCRLSPDGWARRAIAAFDNFAADRVVVEVNNGGDMVSHTLRTVRPTLPITVVHASRGKQARAEPVAALYEQCIGLGTAIATRHGSMPIENVQRGMEVVTREGWRRVLWAGQTDYRQTICISAGDYAVVCTLDHLVYVVGRGFVQASTVVPKRDIMLAWKAFTTAPIAPPAYPAMAFDVGPVVQKSAGPRRASRYAPSVRSAASVTTYNPTATTGQADTKAGSCSTARYGSPHTDHCLPAMTCITATATSPTTDSKTSLPCHPESIKPSMYVPPTTWPLENALPLSSATGGVVVNYGPTPASSAGPHSRAEGCACDSALQAAIHAIGIDSVEAGPFLPVFDLTVDGAAEFFAGGLLVHNCRVWHAEAFPELEDQLVTWTPASGQSPDRLDALVWALTDLAVQPPSRWGAV